jgi:hypothetical protein
VYEEPLSVREPVVWIDEKPVVLQEEVRPLLAMQPGRVARRDAANIFCGVQPKAGRHFTKVARNRSSPEFADYRLDIVVDYPEADTIQLVMDNLSLHTCKALVDRFGTEAGNWLLNRFTAHCTPKHGSWLNPGRLPSLYSPGNAWADAGWGMKIWKESRAWNRRVNRDQVKIQWSFTRKKARQKFGYTITPSRYSQEREPRLGLGSQPSRAMHFPWLSSVRHNHHRPTHVLLHPV